MIFKYPEQFIVPVVYMQNLKDKDAYRCKKSKSLQVGKLVIPDDESNDNEIFLAEVDIYGAFQNKDKNYLKMDEDVLQEPNINGHIAYEDLENEDIKGILKDIDEDYANSETLDMK